MVINGGPKPRLRAPRKRDWTKAKADRFIETLAETCNVTLAAQAIGVAIPTVYKRRAKDAGFRAGWDQALAIGYSRLEMMMLERALHGVKKTVVLSNGETKVMREYSDRVALTLLRMHRENAAIAEESVEANDYQEACDRIVARLQRLRERDERGVETKGAVDRLTLINWGLGAGRAPG